MACLWITRLDGSKQLCRTRVRLWARIVVTRRLLKLWFNSSSIPLNGGAQAYLAYAYGPLVSYLFAWTAISALRPGLSSPRLFVICSCTSNCIAGGNAVVSLIFAEYLNRLIWHTTRDQVSPDDIPQWAIKLTAVAAVLIVSMICAATRNLGTRAAVVFTSVKVR